MTSSLISKRYRRCRAGCAPHDLPFPFNIRRPLGGWKFLFLDGQPFKPDPSQSAARNRGAYLVNGPGHCAECHSPRNVFGGIVERQRFAGGPDPEGSDGWIPNITQAGIGDYSEQEIARLLETGEMPNGDSVGGAMRAVVRNTAQLAPEDRAAMAAYVKSLPPVEGPKRRDQSPPRLRYVTLPRIPCISAAENARNVWVRTLPSLRGAQSERRHARIIGRLDHGDDVELAERPEQVLHGRSGLLRHVLEGVRPLRAVLDVLDSLLGKAASRM